MLQVIQILFPLQQLFNYHHYAVKWLVTLRNALVHFIIVRQGKYEGLVSTLKLCVPVQEFVEFGAACSEAEGANETTIRETEIRNDFSTGTVFVSR